MDKSNSFIEKRQENIQERKSVIVGNLAGVQVNDQEENQKVSRFNLEKKFNTRPLTEKENIEQENKKILEMFNNDIFPKTTQTLISSVNKFSNRVTDEKTKEEVLKIITSTEKTMEEKNNLYFKLKARNYLFFI